MQTHAKQLETLIKESVIPDIDDRLDEIFEYIDRSKDTSDELREEIDELRDFKGDLQEILKEIYNESISEDECKEIFADIISAQRGEDEEYDEDFDDEEYDDEDLFDDEFDDDEYDDDEDEDDKY